VTAVAQPHGPFAPNVFLHIHVVDNVLDVEPAQGLPSSIQMTAPPMANSWPLSVPHSSDWLSHRTLDVLAEPW